jgi:SAM-dependent methyltransferase
VYVLPRPTETELNEFYGPAYFVGGELRYDDFGLPEMNAVRAWPALKNHLGARLPESGRLLDVGCSSGAFLATARDDGWSVVGTEQAEFAAQRAREEHGVTVFTGSLLPPEDAGQFDLITAWHVLEHLVDPLDALRSLRDRLASNGTLFIDVPSWGSIGRRVRRERWAQLTPPEHLNFFTKRSLSSCLRRAGFRDTNAFTMTPWHPVHLMQPRDWPFFVTQAVVHQIASRAGMGAYVRATARA